MKDIIRALNSDEDFRRAFKDNIAMAFKDGYARCEKKYKNRGDIHRIANEAAEYFLEIWLNHK